ncbi:sigma-70 family RNA polymerase sigma factor [Flavicella sediminum]|uniref:sigma-70 family RNA polymerase sigma factor n=1 Tax=Flavicella sediminum TaxID=2585141 RepID=UPI00111E5B1A|nr:sigma-70 family RNA polymerase sigma factor [Flavicella sediminum]
METEKIWKEFSNSLLKFILSKVKNPTVADDILQEVFIKIHLQKETLQKKDRLKSWIFTICNNTINDYFRKHTLATTNELKEAADTSKNENHDAKDCLLPLILNLPKHYKEALLLSELKGWKQQAVADQLKISLPAAKSRILRGREALKKGFIACCDYTLDEHGHLIGEHKDKADCKVCSS